METTILGYIGMMGYIYGYIGDTGTENRNY